MEENQRMQEKMKQEKEERQKKYNAILAEQLKERNTKNNAYGTMTENERRLNMKDLSVIN